MKREIQDLKTGKQYTSKRRRVVRTLLEFSDCGKYGHFKCVSLSRVYYRWIFLNAWGVRTIMIEIEL